MRLGQEAKEEGRAWEAGGVASRGDGGWERRLGSEQHPPVCGREAQRDAEAGRGAPGLAGSFVNSMTMESKLFLTQLCGSLLLFPSPLWAQNNF